MSQTLYKIRQKTIEKALQDPTITNEKLVYASFKKGSKALLDAQDQFAQKRESGGAKTPDGKVIEKSFMDLVEVVCVFSHVFDLDLPSSEEIQEYVYAEVDATTVNDGILSSLAAYSALAMVIGEFYVTEAGERDFDPDFIYDWFVEILAMASVFADLGDIDISELIHED